MSAPPGGDAEVYPLGVPYCLPAADVSPEEWLPA
jgi:hypothetical protein